MFVCEWVGVGVHMGARACVARAVITSGGDARVQVRHLREGGDMARFASHASLVSVGLGTTALEVIQTMAREKLHRVPVIDEAALYKMLEVP